MQIDVLKPNCIAYHQHESTERSQRKANDRTSYSTRNRITKPDMLGEYLLLQAQICARVCTFNRTDLLRKALAL